MLLRLISFLAVLLWAASAFAACPAWMTLSGATCQIETFPPSGNLVGTTDAQTLSNKTLTSPTIGTISNGGGTLTLPTVTGTLLDSANNLSDLGSAASARTNLGLGSLATQNSVGVSSGGTGLSSGTSGGILSFTGSGVLASSAALPLNGFVLGGGAGATPTGQQITGLVLGNGTSAPSGYGGTSAGANQFMTALSASGAGSFAQPSFSGLSGSAACSQMPALTGAVTSSAGSCVTSIVGGGSADQFARAEVTRLMGDGL